MGQDSTGAIEGKSWWWVSCWSCGSVFCCNWSSGACFLKGGFSQGRLGTTLMTGMTRHIGGMEQEGGINFVVVYD